MDRSEQQRRAEAFLALHRGTRILLLANAWDASSAKVFEDAGFPALGTTSAGISASLGYADGQRMSLEENAEVVRRIASRVRLPVSADLERGYADDPEGSAAAARAVLEAGAVGINIEDGTGDPSQPLLEPPLLAGKIRAIRQMARSVGIPLVVNARTDVYLVGQDEGADRLSQTLERARAYLQAGADCIFVPDTGDLDHSAIRELVRGIEAPLNLIAGAHTPPVSELQQLGVARLSLGPRPMRALLGVLRRMSRELLDQGTYRLMTDGALSYADVNAWFSGR